VHTEIVKIHPERDPRLPAPRKGVGASLGDEFRCSAGTHRERAVEHLHGLCDTVVLSCGLCSAWYRDDGGRGGDDRERSESLHGDAPFDANELHVPIWIIGIRTSTLEARPSWELRDA
jgi:hypothetical protein